MKHNLEYESRLIMSTDERRQRYEQQMKEHSEWYDEEAKELKEALIHAFQVWRDGPSDTESDKKLADAAKAYFQHKYIWID